MTKNGRRSVLVINMPTARTSKFIFYVFAVRTKYSASREKELKRV